MPNKASLRRRGRECRFDSHLLQPTGLGFESLEARRLLTINTWTGGSGDWADAANWSEGHVPLSTEDVVIIPAVTVTVSSGNQSARTIITDTTSTLSLTGGTLIVSAATTLNGNVSMSSGTLGGAGNVTLAGVTTWSGGTMSGSGTTIVSASGTLNLNGSIRSLHRVLQNDGTVSWTAGTLAMSNGTFNNNGSFTADSASTLQSYGSGGSPNAFNNAGTFTKLGAGTTSFTTSASGVTFNNTGTVDVQAATLSLFAGGTHSGNVALASGTSVDLIGTSTVTPTAQVTGAGTLRVQGGTTTFDGQQAASGTFAITGGTVNYNTTSFDGTVSITGGTANFNGTTLNGNVSMSSGTLGGSGNVTLAGLTTWSGGTMSGSGTTIVSPSGTLNLTGNTRFLRRVLQNDGTVSWTAGTLAMGNGTFNNNGSFTADSASTLQSLASGGSMNAFNNAGTFTKLGTGSTWFTSSSGVTFNNTGTVDVQVGTLSLSAGGTHSGNAALASGTSLNLGGTSTVTPTGQVTGDGTLLVTSGTTSLDGQQAATGTFAISSGTVNYNTASFGGTVSITGGTANFNGTTLNGSVSMSSGTLGGAGNVTLAGSTTWSGGTMSGAGTTIVSASGTLNLSGNARSLNRVLTNDGTVSWTAGTFAMGNGTFNNNGSFTADSADSLQSYGSSGVSLNEFNNAGTFTKLGTGTTSFTTSSSAVTFNNTGTVDVQAGTLTFNTVSQVSGTTLTGGTWNVAGTLNLPGSNITENQGVVTLSGSGAFPKINSMTNNVGSFALLGGKSFTTNSNLQSPGSIAVGPASTLTVSGALTLSPLSAVNVQLGGTQPSGQFGKLIATGTATLDGTLNLSVVDGYLPQLGDASFQIITFPSEIGYFAAVNGRAIGGVQVFQDQLSATSVLLNVIANSSPSTVVGRHLFYNQSGTAAPLRYDGNNAAINANDDLAIAANKVAYLPGSGAATFANVSSYTKGINGIMIDLAGAHGTITAADFIFRVGNNNTPNSWVAAPAPNSISVRAGAGVGGSDRVVLTWANGAITKKWLEVIVLANANTGLPQKAGYPVGQGDVFFFGSAVANSGSGDSSTQATVNTTDELAARNNPAGLGSNVPITNLFDYNRDGQVNVTDALASRNNFTNAGNVVRYISVANPPAAPEFSPAADDGSAPFLSDSNDDTMVNLLSHSIDVGLASSMSGPSKRPDSSDMAISLSMSLTTAKPIGIRRDNGTVSQALQQLFEDDWISGFEAEDDDFKALLADLSPA